MRARITAKGEHDSKPRFTAAPRRWPAGLSKAAPVRVPRVHVDAALEPGSTLKLPAAQDHYLTRVLRLGAGSRLLLFNGDGFDYSSVLGEGSGRGTSVRIESRLQALPRSPLAITLVQGLCRGERMDYVLQKATELGVAAVQPVDTARSEVRLEPGKLERRMAHWRNVIVSACEQCGRAELPELLAPLTLSSWLGTGTRGRRLVLRPEADRPLAQVHPYNGFELLVGPEGGFDDAECAQLARAGVESVRLGPRVLRTETAGPAAIAVLQACFGDLA